MLVNFRLIAIKTVALIVALGVLHPTSAQVRAQLGEQVLKSIVHQLVSQRAEEVEILCVPAYVMTDARLTPDLLRSDYHYRLTIPRFSATPHLETLVAALKRTTATSSPNPADLRWGLHITLSDGTVHRLYMDGYGRFGQIDDVQVAYGGGLHTWFRSFSKIMK